MSPRYALYFIQIYFPYKNKLLHLYRRQIPDTKWYIVNTTEGNEFYYNSETKQSVWEVPEEITEAVKVFKEQEEKDAQNQRSNDSAGLKRKANDEEVSGSEDFKRAKGSVDEGEVEGTELVYYY
jgi:hypothetical protein